MDFVTVSTGLILPYGMGLPIRYIHVTEDNAENMKAKALTKLMKELEIGMNCTESYSEEEAKNMLGL